MTPNGHPMSRNLVGELRSPLRSSVMVLRNVIICYCKADPEENFWEIHKFKIIYLKAFKYSIKSFLSCQFAQTHKNI